MKHPELAGISVAYIEMEEQLSGIGIEHLPDIRRVRLVGKNVQTTHSTPVYIPGLNSRVSMNADVEGGIGGGRGIVCYKH